MPQSERQRTATVTEDAVRDYLRAVGRTALLTAAEEADLARRIEAGVAARRTLDENDSAGIELDATERRRLRAAAADGARAKDHMVRANVRLVVSIAKRYPTPVGVSLLDLVQEGTIGLMRAVDKFDHRLGLKLSTYATWWIRQSIGRALADQGRTIRLPVHAVELHNRVARTRLALAQELGREPDSARVGAELDLTAAQVDDILRVGREPVSLHAPVGEDTELGALIPDDAPDPADLVAAAQLRGGLDAVLATLTDRERTVILLRYGLDRGEPRTLEQVSTALGVSRERVRQLEAKALGKLRQPTRRRRLEGMLG